MLLFKPFQKFLLPPKFFTSSSSSSSTDSKPHLLHLHHHHHVKHHFQTKAHFKSTTLSSSPLSPPPPPSDSLPSAADSSSSLTTTIVDFLMDSGGLSYVKALQVIRQKPTLLNNEGRKPRLVIAYFESIGFSKTHISKLISKYPGVLVSDVEKTLKPKIQVLNDYFGGFSKESDILADLIVSQPNILRTVETKPALDFIKRFVKTNEDLIKIIRGHSNFTSLVSSNNKKSIEPNIHVLRHHGVPDSEIKHLVLSSLFILMRTPKVFKRIVERIVSLGFKPETRKFSKAVSVMCRLSKPTWDSKIDLLKGLGWSDEQILDAFRRDSHFLGLSGENLKESIEFYNQTLNWDASILSKNPQILNYSLKKRVIPRYAVLKCLMSKEIIKKNTRFLSMLSLNETKFLSRCVFEYQDQLPYLYEVYENECMLGCNQEDNGEITNQQVHDDVVDMTV